MDFRFDCLVRFALYETFRLYTFIVYFNCEMEIMLQNSISWVEELFKLDPMPHNLLGFEIGNDEILLITRVVDSILISNTLFLHGFFIGYSWPLLVEVLVEKILQNFVELILVADEFLNIWLLSPIVAHVVPHVEEL